MPVTEPNVPPFLVRNLELVEEDSEFSLRWQAATMNGRVRRETIVISHDRPKVRYPHRNWPINGADLDKNINPLKVKVLANYVP
jgi:hypothetical protein